MKVSIEQRFTYKRPQTEKRIKAHESINNAALDFALIVEQFVEDERCREMTFFAIQQARMFANQGATIDEIVLEQT